MLPFQGGFFDIVSILYGLLGVATLRELVRRWKPFWDDTVTPDDRSLAGRVAFFVLVPLGVFLHELGHAIATWQVGGQVREFHWRVFWGYIVPEGNFSPVQAWWISLCGNLVSVALGALTIPLIPLPKKPILREILYTFAKVELVFSLVIYPLWSFSGGDGDWITIYDFSIRPYAQWTLAAHVLLLCGVWWFERSGVAARWRLGTHAQRVEPVPDQDDSGPPLA
jgi:hypothetical protein